MKTLGIILFSIGVSLLLFLGYSLLKDRGKTISPVPQDEGVKVIFVTPTE